MTQTLTDPVEVVGAFLDAAVAYLADDCEYTNVPVGTVRSLSAVREVLGPLSAPIREHKVVVSRKSHSEVHHGRISVWRDYSDLASAAKIHDPDA